MRWLDRRTPRVFQYGVIQMILFVMGIMLAIGVVKETGAFDDFAALNSVGMDDKHPGVLLHGVLAGIVEYCT